MSPRIYTVETTGPQPRRALVWLVRDGERVLFAECLSTTPPVIIPMWRYDHLVWECELVVTVDGHDLHRIVRRQDKSGLSIMHEYLTTDAHEHAVVEWANPNP